MNNSILNRIRNSQAAKVLASFTILTFIGQMVAPTTAFALTSGPSQPEVQSFEPVGTTQMVDLFTGDFTYNIPLFELPGPNGGYPFNIAYHSGIGMDQEASWVGLGWNLNPGAIVRTKRGLPDDFHGDHDKILRTTHIKKSHTISATASSSVEIFGADSKLSLKSDLRIYYNNYRGVGYSLDPTFGYNFGGGVSGGFGLQLSSNEGVGIEPSISLETELKNGLGASGVFSSGFNSRNGLNLSLEGSFDNGIKGTSSFSFSKATHTPTQQFQMENRSLAVSVKTGISVGGIFGNLGLTGSYSTQYLKDNGEVVPTDAYGYNYLHHAGDDDLMDFNREKDGTVRRETPNLAAPGLTYDYYNIQGQGTGGMFRPFRSEIGGVHDPAVKSKSRGGSVGFDVGAQHAGLVGSYSGGSTYTGAWKDDNPVQNYYAFRGTDKASSNGGGVVHSDYSPAYEPFYYKVHGEHTSMNPWELDHIGGEGPVRVALDEEWSGVQRYFEPEKNLLVGNTQDYANQPYRRPLDDAERMPRNKNVQALTNKILTDASDNPVLGEFDVKYFTSNQTPDFYNENPDGTVERGTKNYEVSGVTDQHNVEHQQAGFSILGEDGLRHVYGLPAYNYREVERLYSVDPDVPTTCYPHRPILMDQSGDEVKYDWSNTNEFFNKTETPPYAHSYLLTSILGADYVDADNIPGPSQGDYGYWVKLDYAQPNPGLMKWRAPFKHANFIEGLETSGEDDQASFVYGEKELFFLARAETKTHVAIFHTSKREDAMGPHNEFNGAVGTNDVDEDNRNYKLDKIELYEREAFYAYYNDNKPYTKVVPIKTVHLEYDYSLCPDAPNNSKNAVMENGVNINAGEGKLTLQKLWFTYQENDRGALSPYDFTYSDNNPEYSLDENDRWGNYKKLPDGETSCYNLDYPYVEQFDKNIDQIDDAKVDFKDAANLNASAWHLTKIDLPTGSSLNIEYEADDYAYVQHKKANQMFKTSNLGSCNVGSVGGIMYIPSPKNPTASERRIYFDLEHPIPANLNLVDAAKEVKKQYIDPIAFDNGYQLYYKIKGELRDGKFETISGYLDLANDGWGVDASCTTVLSLGGEPAAAHYTKAYVELEEGTTYGGDKYHPLSEAIWQHMRINNMRMMMATGDLSAPDGSSKQVRQEKVRSLASQFNEIKKMLKGYREYCYDRNFGKRIKPEESWIRLGTPDGIKIGGGNRVASVTINDEWETMTGGSSSIENDGMYGQHYDYSTTDAEGRTISSGVAQYEPMLGGDEIALRHARNYPEKIPVMSNNNLFFQFPVNESYFPGASVGYSKVTVSSKATQAALDNPSPGSLTTSTGITVNEFYTARDFPVITNETAIDMRPYNLYIPLPLIGQVRINNLTASQGYSIELNDMHGKPHKITNYGLDQDSKLNPNPISSVEYVYRAEKSMYEKDQVMSLQNEVDVITENGVDPVNQLVGVEYEFFTDQRQSRSTSKSGGLNFNTDIIPLVGPIPTPWPSAYEVTSDLRQIVTNKIIHKTGLLEKVIATDGQSIIETENLAYDALTGQPLLTTVTNKYHGVNDYEKPIYSYNYPAHWYYDGMGAAYQNHRFVFEGIPTNINLGTGVFDLDLTLLKDQNQHAITAEKLAPYLIPGDEFIITDGNSALGTATLLESYLLGEEYDQQLNGDAKQVFRFHSEVTLSNNQSTTLTFINVRSGRRNHLTASVGSVQALQNPIEKTWANNTTNTPDLSAEIVDFLNSVLTCEGQLPIKDFDLHGNKYYDQDGNQLLPILSELVSVLRIAECNTNNTEEGTGNACSNCYAGGGVNGPKAGYEIALMQPTAGEFNEEIHCIARRLDASLNHTVITGFTAGNQTIDATYESYSATSACVILDLPELDDQYIAQMSEVLNASAVEFRDFWNHDFNPSANESCNGTNPSDPNLYAAGKKGIWRPYKNYYYKDDRKQTGGTNDHLDLANDGVYAGSDENNYFQEFVWCPNFSNPRPAAWIPNQVITKYNTDGFEVENRDISGIYSAALYGYNGNLATAVGANMRFDEFFFESFDDPNVSYSISGINSPYGPVKGLAHTGEYALVLSGDDQADLLKLTKAAPGQKFHLSAWTAAASSTSNPSPTHYPNHTYDLSQLACAPSCITSNASIQVRFYAKNGTSQVGSYMETIKPVGAIIEGWQKVEGDFTIPNDLDIAYIGIRLLGGQNPVNLIKAWDDIRLFPFDGNMQSYVYDRENFRLQATLDQNNFATIYSYDEEGNLFLVKKETTEGIVTVQESRSHTAIP